MEAASPLTSLLESVLIQEDNMWRRVSLVFDRRTVARWIGGRSAEWFTQSSHDIEQHRPASVGYHETFDAAAAGLKLNASEDETWAATLPTSVSEGMLFCAQPSESCQQLRRSASAWQFALCFLRTFAVSRGKDLLTSVYNTTLRGMVGNKVKAPPSFRIPAT